MNKKSSRSMKIFLLLLIVLFSIVIFTVIFLLFPSKGKKISIEYGNTLVEQIDKYLSESEKEVFNIEKEKAIFYFSGSCSGCIEKLDLVARLSDIYANQIQFIVIWDDAIPSSELEQLSKNSLNNVSLDGKCTINTGLTPQFFMADSNNIISFVANDTSMKPLVSKLINDYSTNDLHTDIANNLHRSIENKDSETSKEFIVIFTSQDCSACEDLEAYIIENDLTKKYDFVYVKDYAVRERDNEVVDQTNYFYKVLGVDVYPKAFLYNDQEELLLPLDNIISINK